MTLASDTVVVTGVAADNSSAKIAYQPVPGAADYRVYDVTDPHTVKYAGIIHPANNSVPNTEIEWNRLSDGKPHTLVVQAVDQLGPVPRQNQYDDNNQPLVMPSGAMASGAMPMLGSNEGMTADGNDSINGQGPSTDTPHVIAQSAPFVVQANPAYRAIPSRPDAQQTFFDTFDSSEATNLAGPLNVDPTGMTMDYTLNAGTDHGWTIHYQGADTSNSRLMVMDGHLMDILFDGGTPGTSNPLHTQYGVMAMSPDATPSFAGGQILHLTTEVDMDQAPDGRRWMEWYVVPADDPITDFTASTFQNRSKTGFQVFLTDGGCAISEVVNGRDTSIAGALGQAPNWCSDNINGTGNGRGIDDRSRVDIFLSQTRYAVFEDGQLVDSHALPTPLPFTQARVYQTHYVYHSALMVQELKQYDPQETYWIEQMPYSDERHWDNMGQEVLPASDAPADWSAFASLVQPPAFVAPGTAPGGSGSVPTTTSTPVPPVATASATNTPVPPAATATKTNPPNSADTSTPVPTDTAVPAAPAATSTPIVLPVPTGTSVTPSFTFDNVTESDQTIAPGETQRFAATITAGQSIGDELVDFEVYNAAGDKVWQTWHDDVTFKVGVSQTFTAAFDTPSTLPPGPYRLKIGIFGPGWSVDQDWNNRAAQFKVAYPERQDAALARIRFADRLTVYRYTHLRSRLAPFRSTHSHIPPSMPRAIRLHTLAPLHLNVG